MRLAKFFETLWLPAAIGICFNAGTCHGERSLVQETIIDAPVARVWAAFTDEVEAQAWIAPKTRFDIRVGGEMRTSYNPESTLDDEHTIVNKVLSLEPERMLSIQNVQAPKGFPHADLFAKTWSVVYFESLGPNRTKLRSVGLGYGDGPEWDQIYTFFDKGNSYLYGELKKLLEQPIDSKDKTAPSDSTPTGIPSSHSSESSADATMERIGKLVGGAWIHESQRPDKSLFRARNELRWGPSAHCIVTSGWLGDAQGMFHHGAGLIYRDPGSREVRFVNIDEAGSVAEGKIESRAGGDKLVWDWRSKSADGTERRFDVVLEITSPDEYIFHLGSIDNVGKVKPMLDAPFRRVDAAPPEFTRQTGTTASAK